VVLVSGAPNEVEVDFELRPARWRQAATIKVEAEVRWWAMRWR
jgi:hypothetical protein